MHDKPFDVNTIEDDIAASLSETHDYTGSRIGLRRKERRDEDRGNSGSPTPLPKELTEAVQEALDLQVHNPPHYNSHPSGVECIEITEHMNFNIGSAMKYLWRAADKGNYIVDLEKAVWYIQREIHRTRHMGLS